jgi:hypothetical protein
MTGSKCDRCGETVADIDAGFSPGVHGMRHDCGGTWRVVDVEDPTSGDDPASDWDRGAPAARRDR